MPTKTKIVFFILISITILALFNSVYESMESSRAEADRRQKNIAAAASGSKKRLTLTEKAEREKQVRQAKARQAAKAAPFLVCKTKEIWEKLNNARLAGRDAFVNKANGYIVTELCVWIPKSAKCVITNVGWSGIDEIYVLDKGPLYAENTESCDLNFN